MDSRLMLPSLLVLLVISARLSLSRADTTLTIIHYEIAATNGSDPANTAGLMHVLERALAAYPGALLLNPTGHLGKRLWIQHDATAPNLADIVQPSTAQPLGGRTDPLLAANVRVPGSAHVRPSTVLPLRGGGRVGVVGFVSEAQAEQPEAAALLVHVSPPEGAVQREARRLRGNGVSLVMALGNAGFPEDEAVAAGVPELDAVVAARGGEDGYPLAVRQPAGKLVPLLRAPPGTVCVTQLLFGAERRLVDWGGYTVPIPDEAGQER